MIVPMGDLCEATQSLLAVSIDGIAANAIHRCLNLRRTMPTARIAVIKWMLTCNKKLHPLPYDRGYNYI